MAASHTWTFTDKEGSFSLDSPESTSSLYFPLVNEAGMMSSVTPTLQGDIKTGQDSFLTRPVSVEDLLESRAARNVWIEIEGSLPWSANGCSAAQVANHFRSEPSEHSWMEGGLLWHRLHRQHPETGLKTELTSFVPASEDQVELLQISLFNPGPASLDLSVTFAVPIFGRSADNLRDHRHVTSLLNRIQVLTHGVVVRPTLVFDETGHHVNRICYAVAGTGQAGEPPDQIFPLVDAYRGEGGTLDWPEAVVSKLTSPFHPGQTLAGGEALGGMRFGNCHLEAGQSATYIIILGITDQEDRLGSWIERYGGQEQFDHWLATTRQYWKDRLDPIRIETADKRRDGWLRWTSIQPILRQLFGNSFLPYHDYGRGGRGWRDLWQDILGLLLMQTEDVSPLLEGNFAGIRFDGSNATIIGRQPGEFIADRNNIPRVWMDHGAWPLITTSMYLDWTGDIAFLLRRQPYFKDHLTHRSQRVDPSWSQQMGTKLQTSQGETYHGSIFEHLLIQNLVPFFNVGSHNCIRLEGADWNDALDMASQNGESVAFSAFYAGNLFSLAGLARQLIAHGHQEIELAAELGLLLDSIFDPIEYDQPAAKQQRLEAFLDASAARISGEWITVDLDNLARDLDQKASWMKMHLRTQEWIEAGDLGWFNGYYDEQGRRVEGVFEGTVQMTLAGQVFQLMFGIATDQQTAQVTKSVDRYLYDPSLHGVRLNTEFKYRKDALGRVFGFAYGEKENGAMFSHMAVMYAYALFERNLPRQALQLLDGIYQVCQDFSVSRIYPGIPEYLDPAGRGRYPYLTGSASWYLLTLITRVFGIQGVDGHLALKPFLAKDWFDEKGQISLQTPFAGRLLRIVFHNPDNLEPEQAVLERVEHRGKPFPAEEHDGALLIRRQDLQTLPARGWHQLDVYLAGTDSLS